MLAVVLTPLAFWLGDSPAERGLLLVAIVLVLLVELLNSAIEAVVDRIGLEYHALSKKAKDIGSAAVFISLVAFVVLWVAVLL
jgi:diacylglycerol kinase (ATP)